MKKNLLLSCVLILCVALLPLQAQSKADHPLVGVWQLTHKPNESAEDIFLPFFKVLNADGSFFNLQYSSYKIPGMLSHKGSFVITSDNEYTENIASALVRTFEGNPSKIRYRLKDANKTLYIQWMNPSSQGWVSEKWVRVE